MSDVETEWRELPPVIPKPRGIHPVLLVLLVVFTLSGASCVGCLVVGYRTSQRGVDYVEAELPRIARPWNAAALIERAAPEFLAVMPEDKAQLFVSFAENRLGQLETVGTVNSGPWQSFMSTQGFFVTSVQWVDCHFEKGPARVTLSLVWRDGRWQIQGFNLGSDLLMK